MKERVELKALTRFVCIGEKCPQHCCWGWSDIDVDADTLAKWRAMGAEGDALLRNTRASDDGKGVVLAFSADRVCVNVSAEGLCSIQCRYGHDILPETCRTYPRVAGGSPIRDVHTAQLSCPEMVRLVLFDDVDAPVFSRSGEPGGGGASLALLSLEYQAAWHLDRFVDAVLAERKFPLNVRVYHIASRLAEMATLSADGRLDSSWFQGLQRGLRNTLYDINTALKSRRLGPEPADGGMFWKAVHDLFIARGMAFSRFGIDANPMIDALAQASSEEGDLARAYAVVRSQLDAARPVLRKRFHDLLARYLRVSFMNKEFPWQPVRGNFIATFLNAVLPLAMVQLILSARLAQPGDMDAAYVQMVISLVEREMGHGARLLESLFQRPAMLRIDQYVRCFLDVG